MKFTVRLGRKNWLAAFRLTTFSFLALVLVGCSSPQELTKGPEEGKCGVAAPYESLTQFKVVGGASVEAPAVEWGIQEACFSAEGLALEIQLMPASIESVAALTNGSVDVIALSVADYLTYVANGNFNGKIIASSTGYSASDLERAKVPPLYPGELIIQTGIFVDQDSEIQSLAQLSGAKVAASGSDNVVGWAIADAVDATGGDSSTLEILNIPTESRIIALEQGDVDAVMFTGRFAEDAISSGLRLIGYPGAYFYTEGPFTVWVTSPEILEDKNEEVLKFKKAIEAVNTELRDLNENQDSYRQVLIEKFQIEPDVAQSTKVPNYWIDQITVPQLSLVAEKLLRLGVIKAVPKLDNLISN